MRKVYYAGGWFVTGDEIAEAIVLYAEALAKKGGSAHVDIPVRSAGGEAERALLLIGPASQFLVVPCVSETDEVSDPPLVEEMLKAAEMLGITRARSAVDAEEPVDFGQVEY